MREFKVYLVLLCLMGWIFGGLYWINAKFCEGMRPESNYFQSKTYRNQEKDAIKELKPLETTIEWSCNTGSSF